MALENPPVVCPIVVKTPVISGKVLKKCSASIVVKLVSSMVDDFGNSILMINSPLSPCPTNSLPIKPLLTSIKEDTNNANVAIKVTALWLKAHLRIPVNQLTILSKIFSKPLIIFPNMLLGLMCSNFENLEVNKGIKVKATNKLIKVATATVILNWVKIPAINPPVSDKGTNTTTITRVMETTVPPISRIPS